MVLQFERTTFVRRVLPGLSPLVGGDACEDEEDKVNDPGGGALVTRGT